MGRPFRSGRVRLEWSSFEREMSVGLASIVRIIVSFREKKGDIMRVCEWKLK
jgi:hypothetical protein